MKANWKNIAVSIVCYVKTTSFELHFFTTLEKESFIPELREDGFLIHFGNYFVGMYEKGDILFYMANEPCGEKIVILENSQAVRRLFDTAIDYLTEKKDKP